MRQELTEEKVVDQKRQMSTNHHATYMRKWRKENPEKYKIIKIKTAEYMKKRRKEYPEKQIESNRKWSLKNRWLRKFYSITARCTQPKQPYCKKGIRIEMTKEEFKYLWNKYKAENMKQPSVHRVDNKKNYTLDNCIIIEYEKHIGDGRWMRKRSKKHIKAFLKDIISHIEKTGFVSGAEVLFYAKEKLDEL